MRIRQYIVFEVVLLFHMYGDFAKKSPSASGKPF